MSTTVVIINYNYELYIRDTLNSVFNQTVPFDEVIIIDDCSTDKSVEVIQEYIKKYPSIRFYQNDKNRGVTYTTNRAINLATSDYIAAIASDDIYLKNFNEACQETLKEYPDTGIICSKFSYFEDDKISQITPYPRSFNSKETVFLKGPTLLKAMRSKKFWIPSPAMYRKDLFDLLGGYDHQFGEYTDFFMYAMISFEKGACYIPEILSAIRVHSNRFSDKVDLKTRAKSWAYFLKLITKGKFKQYKKQFRKSHIFYLFESPFFFFLLKQPRFWSIADYTLWKKMFQSYKRERKKLKAKI